MVCTVKSVVIGSAVRGKHNRVQDVIYTRIQFYICTTIVIITSTPVMLLTKIIHQCSENKFLSNLGCSETYYIMRTHVRPKSFENRGTRWVCEKVAQNVAKTIFFKTNRKNFPKNARFFSYFENNFHSKQSLKGRKIAQSGHPVISKVFFHKLIWSPCFT
jgi:hypothetical protein